jgi:hypothetical protein
MEPTSAAGSGYVVTKVMSAVAGLIGGLSLAVFWQPEKIRAHGKMAAGAIIGGISVGGSVALSGIVAKQLGLDMTNADTALGLGFLMGLISVGIINFLANFFDKREKADILDVAREVRSSAAKPPVAKRKPPVKTGGRK